MALDAAAPRPFLLATVAGQVRAGETSEDSLRAPIMKDLASQAPDADPYLTRLHSSAVLRALREMRSR